MSTQKRFNTLKWAVVFTVLFTVVTVNAFSGGQGESSKAQDKNNSVREITVASIADPAVGLPEVEAAINKITVPRINTRVKFLPIESGAYSQQISLMMASGEKIDLVRGTSFGTVSFSVMHAQHQLMDITDLLPKYAPDLIRTVTEIIPDFLEGTRVNGRIHSVSGFFNKVNSDYFLGRADILDKHNIDIYGVKGLDDVGNILGVLKRNEPNQVPIVTYQRDASALILEGGSFYDDFSNPVHFDTLGDSANRLAVVFLSNPENVVNLYKTDNYRKMLERVHDWYKKGYVYKDALINTEIQEILVRNNIGITWTASSEIGVEVAKEERTGYKIRAVKAAPGMITTTTMTRIFWGVPVHSKEPEAALKFLNLMYTDPDINNLLAWGIEGRDYEVKSDGTVGFPAGITSSNAPYHSMDFRWGNQFITKVWTGNPPDLREQARKENQNASSSPLLGFSFDTAPIQNEIAMLSNIISQYRPGLESGTIDPAQGLPAFIKALDGGGAEKVIAEIQKQLNAWKSTKK
ncbi:ABC transporter substrate-binding protein [Spirochaetia bacterium]|nr:ABC transporter substrate-binding protein [Spirochaetia bacterium]